MTNAVHYWTGRGTLCSLDNNVIQQSNHSTDIGSVTCPYCHYQIELNRRAVVIVLDHGTTKNA